MTSPPVWRLLTGTGDGAALRGAAGARNMAIDQSLLASVQAGGMPVLRLYTWDPPCLSLGRNQHANGVYDTARTKAAGIDIVRRPTGGLAVLHDRELTYCVLAPVAALGGARAAYTTINSALVQALRSLGVSAMLAAGGRRRGPVADAADPCFQAPAGGEVVVQGRKLVGSAQRCERGALMQHGSLLLDGSQADILPLLSRPAATDRSPDESTTLAALLESPPAVDDVAAALELGFASTFGIRLAPDTMTCEERARADGLEGYFREAAWTWRR